MLFLFGMLNRHLIFIVNTPLYPVLLLAPQYGRGVSIMKRVKLVVSAFAILATSVFAAHAADDLVIPATQEDAYTPVEVGSGWYIRGDVSYDLSSDTSGSYRTYGNVTAPPAAPAFGYSTIGYDGFDFKSAKELSAGIGYTFNSFLRADLTASYWKRRVYGTDFDPGFTNPAGTLVVCGANEVTATTNINAVGCQSTDTTSFTAIEVMANAYADLGTYHGFTPYVGAGVGMTRLKFNSLTNAASCVDAAGNTIPGCGQVTATHPGQISTRVSYALMAGTAYNLTKNLKLDVGYRYSAIQGGDMFGTLSTHQIKAGLRYEIW
jgi:opacity protein-like surface antigen